MNAFAKNEKRRLKEKREEIVKELIKLEYSPEEVECEVGEAS